MDLKDFIRQNYVTCIKCATGIICLIVFLYQMISLLILYASHPEVLEVQYKRPEKYIFPAITFCNANLIKRSKYCAAYPSHCVKPENMNIFCQRYPHYCRISADPAKVDIKWRYIEDFMIPEKDYYRNYIRDFVPMEDLPSFSDNVSTILFATVGEDDIEGPKFYEKPAKSKLIPCFTQYSRVESDLEPHTSIFSPFDKYSRQVSDYPQLIQKMTLNVQSTEYFIPETKPGIYFTLHSPYESLNPNYKGVFMQPGKRYHVHIQLEEDYISSLDKDCIDYVGRWQKTKKKEPRSQQMCLERCNLDYSLACHDCVERAIMHPTTKAKCPFHNSSLTCSKPDDPINEYRSCESSCKKDCSKLKFLYTVQENPDFEGVLDFENWNLIEISIYMQEPHILLRSYKSTFTSIQVFSSIGGCLCLWICIFVAVIYFPQFVYPYIKRQFSGKDVA